MQRDKSGYPRCAYCRMVISGNGEKGEIDHILYKKKYKHLMFSPYNLILTCSNCNTSMAKGEFDVLDATSCRFVENDDSSHYGEKKKAFLS